MRSTAYGSNNSGKAITIILCLLIIAAAIWAATSDSAGGYISQKIFTPLFSKADPLTTQPVAENTPYATQSSNIDSNGNLVAAQLNYEAKTIYAIQIGAFSSYENAKIAAKDTLAYGGAGYIITTGGYHKLYTSAYLNEAEAQSNKTYLLSNDTDACISQIKIDGVLLDITASQEQIDTIDNAHNTWIKASDDLFSVVSEYEGGAINSSQAVSSVKDIHEDILNAMAELNKYKTQNTITEQLYENLTLCDTQLSSFLSASLSDAEISSSIKYLMIDFIYRFGQYANEISV